MKLAAFDLEIAKQVEDGEDWKAQRPLGISCAEVLASDVELVWDSRLSDGLRLPEKSCARLVGILYQLVAQEFTIVTWNGAGFDWDILAEESGLRQECATLAQNHVDLMFIVLALRGHYLGLDTAAKGMGVRGKLKEVELSGGETLAGMDGAKAPELWAAGEFDAVREYLHEDVRVTLDLAEKVAAEKCIRWTSRSGRPNEVDVPRLYSVKECMALPLPDTSWMTDPPTREGILSWMNGRGA